MSPKQKAKQLIDNFEAHSFMDIDMRISSYESAKQCALIAVDEILNILPQSEYLEDRGEYCENRERFFWKEVKQEIETYGGDK